MIDIVKKALDIPLVIITAASSIYLIVNGSSSNNDGMNKIITDVASRCLGAMQGLFLLNGLLNDRMDALTYSFILGGINSLYNLSSAFLRH